MKTVKLSIESNDGEEEKVTLNFDVQELRILNRYVENCERLRGAPLLQSFPCVQQIKWNFNEGLMEFNISEFQYEQVYDLLHRSRPIFLHREPASFNKVKAIFGKKSQGTILAKILKEIGLCYDKGEYQQYFQIHAAKASDSASDRPDEWMKQAMDILMNKVSPEKMLNADPLFHESTLDAWLNGIEYHQDEDKEETVKRIEERLTQETARGIFVSQMSGRLKAIFRLENLSQFTLNNEASASD